ncbi:MAG: hypothetical protein GXX79_14850 [Actinomycetales bacterium]|nr:hypothetical protein [Actinomycetales bacterium]
MRALYCFDLGTPVDRIERVVGEAGLDAVILGSDLADHDRLRDGLAGSSVDVVINVPVFFDPVFLPDNAACYAVTSRGRRAVEGWLHFACPSSESYWRYRTDRVRRQLERLAPIDPVMITFDFARTFVFWETVRPGTDPAAVVHGCYCATCRQRFHEASDHHVPDEVPVPGPAATCAASSASCSVPDPDSAVRRRSGVGGERLRSPGGSPS